MQMVPAGRAGPRLATLSGFVALERLLLLALRAMGLLAIRGAARPPQPVQARLIVREPLHKVHERRRGFRRCGTDWVVSIDPWHASSLAQFIHGGYICVTHHIWSST